MFTCSNYIDCSVAKCKHDTINNQLQSKHEKDNLTCNLILPTSRKCPEAAAAKISKSELRVSKVQKCRVRKWWQQKSWFIRWFYSAWWTISTEWEKLATRSASSECCWVVGERKAFSMSPTVLQVRSTCFHLFILS